MELKCEECGSKNMIRKRYPLGQVEPGEVYQCEECGNRDQKPEGFYEALVKLSRDLEN